MLVASSLVYIHLFFRNKSIFEIIMVEPNKEKLCHTSIEISEELNYFRVQNTKTGKAYSNLYSSKDWRTLKRKVNFHRNYNKYWERRWGGGFVFHNRPISSCRQNQNSGLLWAKQFLFTFQRKNCPLINKITSSVSQIEDWLWEIK